LSCVSSKDFSSLTLLEMTKQTSSSKCCYVQYSDLSFERTYQPLKVFLPREDRS
jgi:hypothetical protein